MQVVQQMFLFSSFEMLLLKSTIFIWKAVQRESIEFYCLYMYIVFSYPPFLLFAALGSHWSSLFVAIGGGGC